MRVTLPSSGFAFEQDVNEIAVKRMYGNAVLKAKTVGGSSIDLMRFTFAIADMCDAVADFIAFTPEHIQRDIKLFSGKCDQYIFISSASAYQKPLSNKVITEQTPLDNPYWQYSRNKQICEEMLIDEYKNNGFPVTIVRPSHTYSTTTIPVGIHGAKGSFAVIKRMLEGKRIIVHGDGESLWVLTHNSDFAKAFVGILANKKATLSAWLNFES